MNTAAALISNSHKSYDNYLHPITFRETVNGSRQFFLVDRDNTRMIETQQDFSGSWNCLEILSPKGREEEQGRMCCKELLANEQLLCMLLERYRDRRRLGLHTLEKSKGALIKPTFFHLRGRSHYCQHFPISTESTNSETPPPPSPN